MQDSQLDGPIDQKLHDLTRYVQRERSHAAAHPGPPVNGCVSVLPLVPGDAHASADAVTFQFNGWSVELRANGTWTLTDTTNVSSDVKCPSCGSLNVTKRHVDGTFALPETTWKECNDCGTQWEHE